MINVAAIQMVSTTTVNENLNIAQKIIAEAVSKNAKFITLPENFPLMARQNNDYQAIIEKFGDGPLSNKKYK